MRHDIPIGNGQLLVTFDQAYQIRDVYFPHVGQENHAGGGPCRFGVYTDVATNGDSELPQLHAVVMRCAREPSLRIGTRTSV